MACWPRVWLSSWLDQLGPTLWRGLNERETEPDAVKMDATHSTIFGAAAARLPVVVVKPPRCPKKEKVNQSASAFAAAAVVVAAVVYLGQLWAVSHGQEA